MTRAMINGDLTKRAGESKGDRPWKHYYEPG
jgi:hypothetical protein